MGEALLRKVVTRPDELTAQAVAGAPNGAAQPSDR